MEALQTIHHVLILAYYDAKSADKVAADAQPVCKDARGAAYNCMPNHSYNRCVIVHCYESEDMEQGGNVPFWKISVHPFIRFGMTNHISKSASVEDLHITSRTPRELGRKLRAGAALEQFYEFKKQMNSMSLE